MTDNKKLPLKSLMIQGTTSDAGKSTIAVGLCRLLSRLGLRVAPFKPQNMALNSAVTIDGGEIGRAQALQAIACRLAPHSDMNPVLLKPNSNSRSQVIVQGKVWQDMDARTYYAHKADLMPRILESFNRLKAASDFVVIEGAGSPAEINLRKHDLANMGFASEVGCNVIIVADIDRGGVFAHLYGTYELLSKAEKELVSGFIINKFRGDKSLLDSGIRWLEERTGKPVYGILPYLQGLTLDAEDSLSRKSSPEKKSNAETSSVVIISFPRISNHTDFEPLVNEPSLSVSYASSPDEVEACDLLILPGSKNTAADLSWLRQLGWDKFIKRHLRYGGKVIGICGGFQMLGKRISDPFGVETVPCSVTEGLGLLEMETVLTQDKRLNRVSGTLTISNSSVVTGYEIHMGISTGPALSKAAVLMSGSQDGVVSEDENIIGTYIHGIFDESEARVALLRWAGCRVNKTGDFFTQREESIDLIADSIDSNCSVEFKQLLGLA